MKISIITATYNSASTLKHTLESVLNQTYTDIEYILVDGGSKDNTLDIIKEYEPLFKGCMSWKSEPDKGIYDAMNKGIKRATGDIVGILNSDDFYTSNDILETINKNFSTEESLDALYGDIHFVEDKDLTKMTRYYSSKIFKPWLFRFGFMPAHPSFYARKRVFDSYGNFDLNYKIASDYDWLIRVIYKEHIKTKYIPLDMVTMRMGGVSTESVGSRILLNKEIVKACKKYGIWTSLPLLFLKYIYKVFEIRK